jgi:hypothetical protein
MVSSIVAACLCRLTCAWSCVTAAMLGSVAYVHTPETQRAKELLDLYTRLTSPVESCTAVDHRLDILLKVKVSLLPCWTLAMC